MLLASIKRRVTACRGKSLAYSIQNWRVVLLAAATGCLLVLSGCGTADTDSRYPEKIGRNRYDPAPSGEKAEDSSLFGSGGIFGLGGGGKSEGGGGIGVNSYLWRASLDTISFMPLASADPFGGVIITDWYVSQTHPNERFKMTVYILDKRLRADGVKVSVFRQEKGPGGNWVDAPGNAEVGVRIENSILTRARQLRIDSEAG